MSLPACKENTPVRAALPKSSAHCDARASLVLIGEPDMLSVVPDQDLPLRSGADASCNAFDKGLQACWAGGGICAQFFLLESEAHSSPSDNWAADEAFSLAAAEIFGFDFDGRRPSRAGLRLPCFSNTFRASSRAAGSRRSAHITSRA